MLHERVLTWWDEHARPLPWREPGCSAWGVFVSEVMSQQTPIARVLPAWQAWTERWPTPADLAADSPGEAVRMWQRLGYPRRARRLWEAAAQMVERHDGQVPRTHEELLALPGVGAYTAAAVASFAFGDPQVVIDTNVRRVLVRAREGRAQAAPSLTTAESALAADSMPREVDDANTWNAAVMELGALVCTARSPGCDRCPLLDVCAWQRAGCPPYEGPVRRAQAWHGTDRQARGALLAVLRESAGPVAGSALEDAWSDAAQRGRALRGLVEDGLVEPVDGGYALPA
ncbi:A/G-specific adenine glycosylase [Janibacter alkaliphilus]